MTACRTSARSSRPRPRGARCSTARSSPASATARATSPPRCRSSSPTTTGSRLRLSRRTCSRCRASGAAVPSRSGRGRRSCSSGSASSTTPACAACEAARVPAPADLHAWLARHPDLRVSTAEPVTVAGVEGVAFEVEVRFSRPVHSDPFCRRDLPDHVHVPRARALAPRRLAAAHDSVAAGARAADDLHRRDVAAPARRARTRWPRRCSTRCASTSPEPRAPYLEGVRPSRPAPRAAPPRNARRGLPVLRRGGQPGGDHAAVAAASRSSRRAPPTSASAR